MEERAVFAVCSDIPEYSEKLYVTLSQSIEQCKPSSCLGSEHNSVMEWRISGDCWKWAHDGTDAFSTSMLQNDKMWYIDHQRYLLSLLLSSSLSLSFLFFFVIVCVCWFWLFLWTNEIRNIYFSFPALFIVINIFVMFLQVKSVLDIGICNNGTTCQDYLPTMTSIHRSTSNVATFYRFSMYLCRNIKHVIERR